MWRMSESLLHQPLSHLLSITDVDASRVPAQWARRVRRVHFVGIGGAGMGGIAEVLHTLGFEVSGSDARASNMTRHLERLGVPVHIGHDSGHVVGCGLLVRSTAIDEDNPEVVAARVAHVPVVPRAQMLAELMRLRLGIAVAGTHGKTTTTSLVASVLAEGGLDPTYVVGGRLNASGVNARLGIGRYLVAEADESDGTFLLLQPVMSVVTNIDADHMETYGGDFSRLKTAFLEFLHHLPFYGRAIVCGDDPTLSAMLPDIAKPVVTYGLGENVELQARDVRADGTSTHFVVVENDAEPLPVTLSLPGEHNVRNALAAIAVARLVGVDDGAVQRALAGFQGIDRRLQVHGARQLACGEILLVDDYAHHPTELVATLSAARAAWPQRRVVVVFQPHRFSRTRDLFEDFAQALSDVDALVMLEVYSAGEEPISGADARALCRAIRSRGRVEPVFADGIETLPEVLEDLLGDGDVLLTLGAGDVGSVPGMLAARWPAVEANA
jgi:UDP-N-acetylmuramate--alanine ligase